MKRETKDFSAEINLMRKKACCLYGNQKKIDFFG